LFGSLPLDVFASTALRQGGCGKLVRNLNKERQAAAEGYLPIEDANGLRGSQAKFPKNPFCFLLCVRLNACMDDCSFHGPIVSHSQHRCKMFFSFTSNGSLRRIATPERLVTPRLSLAPIFYINTFFLLKKGYAFDTHPLKDSYFLMDVIFLPLVRFPLIRGVCLWMILFFHQE